MRPEEIRNVAIREIASALDLDRATLENGRIRAVGVNRATQIGGVALAPGTELRFKTVSGEDTLEEAILGGEASVAGVACVSGSEITFYPTHPPRVRSMRHAFGQGVDVQGWPAYEMSEVVFHSSGMLQEVRLGKAVSFAGMELPRGSVVRFSGDVSVQLSEPRSVLGTSFPAKTALVFDRSGRLQSAYAPVALTIGAKTFPPKAQIFFTPEGNAYSL